MHKSRTISGTVSLLPTALAFLAAPSRDVAVDCHAPKYTVARDALGNDGARLMHVAVAPADFTVANAICVARALRDHETTATALGSFFCFGDCCDRFLPRTARYVRRATRELQAHARDLSVRARRSGISERDSTVAAFSESSDLQIDCPSQVTVRVNVVK